MRQCVNLIYAVYGSAAVRQCPAVRADVCGSGCGSVQLSSSARSSLPQCAAVWQGAAVRQCAAVRAGVCGVARGSVRQCVWQCVAVLAAVCGCLAVRAAVRSSV